jgi:Putative Flp pilus-assembly TadE/G-like
MDRRIDKARKQEQGQVILLLAIALVALLSMAALAIDVVTLYVARSEAQRAANAAAIAGAKMFATSGFTSVQGGGTPPVLQADVCQNGGPGLPAGANVQAEKVAAQNTVAGHVATVAPAVGIQCNFTAAGNPRIAVTINQGGLPTFFAKIWSRASNSVTATAVAEAYNPSGNGPPIQVAVKPWLIPNCDSSQPNPPNLNCGGSAYFVNPDGTIANNGSFIGNMLTLARVPATGIPAANTYYTLDIPVAPLAQPGALAVCPSTGAPSCGTVGTDTYLDNIACSSQVQFSCRQPLGPGDIPVDNAPGFGNRTNEGTQCLIHANTGTAGLGQGQDILPQPIPNGKPVAITGGDNNPNPALQGVGNISRSDSVVTVPLYDGARLCTGVNCTVNTTVVGFLQLGIRQRMAGPPNGRIEAIILNVAGCNPAPTGSTVSGGGVSPIPVRLITQ